MKAFAKTLLWGVAWLMCGACVVSAEAIQAAPLQGVGSEGSVTLAAARASMEKHQWTAAEAQLRGYLAQGGNAPDALFALALTLFYENRPKDSLAMYTRAAAVRRPAAQDFHFIALDYVLLHDYSDADTWISRAAREAPDDGEITYAMGRIKYTENRFAEAVTTFQRALMLMPHSVKAENNLGLTFEGLNEPEKAIAAYRQAIAWEAGDAQPSAQPLLNLGILLTDRNQLSEALPMLQQAETLAPDDGKVHAALGKLYAREMSLPQAQAELEQAVRAEPNDAGLHFQLGQIYRKEGLGDKAKQELTRAAALDGTHSNDGGG